MRQVEWHCTCTLTALRTYGSTSVLDSGNLRRDVPWCVDNRHIFNPLPTPGISARDFRARPVHLAAPSVRRCGPQVRAQEGPAGVPGPPGPGLDGPGSPVTKRSTFCHVLSRWRVGREEGRKRHSQTLNIDLSLPDRGLLLGLESIHKARGPVPEARHRRRSLVVAE